MTSVIKTELLSFREINENALYLIEKYKPKKIKTSLSMVQILHLTQDVELLKMLPNLSPIKTSLSSEDVIILLKLRGLTAINILDRDSKESVVLTIEEY